MKNRIMIATVLFASISMYSQKEKVVKTKEQPPKTETKVANIDPLGTYERITAKGYNYRATPETMLKIANACYFRADLISAAKWYGQLFAVLPEQEAEIYYRYAQCLKAVKEFTKADEMMAVFHKKRT